MRVSVAVVVGALACALAATGCSDDTVEPAPVLEESDMDGALLTLEDVPEGFRLITPDEIEVQEPPSECALDAPDEPVAEVTIQFEDGPGLSLVQQTVSMYADDGAVAYLDEVRDVFATCDSSDVRVDVRSADDAGDEVAAYRLTLTDSDLPLTTDVTYFRSGNVVVGVATLSVVGPPSAALDEALLEAAVDRLERAIEA